jgi:hypothetical protein
MHRVPRAVRFLAFIWLAGCLEVACSGGTGGTSGAPDVSDETGIQADAGQDGAGEGQVQETAAQDATQDPGTPSEVPSDVAGADSGDDVPSDTQGLDTAPGEPETGGQGAPLAVGLFVHLEGWELEGQAQFAGHAAKIRSYASLFEGHGARLTWETREMLPRAIEKFGDNVLLELEQRGHQVGIHADVGTSLAFTRDLFVKDLASRRKALENLGLHPRHATGVCSWLDWPRYLAEAGFQFTGSTVEFCLKALPPQDQPAAVKDCLVPSACHNPYPAPGDNWMHPWRMSPADFRKAGPPDAVLNIPCRSTLDCLAESMTEESATLCEFAQDDLDRYFVLLDQALAAAEPGAVNVFVLGWSLGTELDQGLLEQWLTGLDAYVAAGKVSWQTLGQVHDAFVAWEGQGNLAPGPGEGAAGGVLANQDRVRVVLEMHSGEGEDPLADCLFSGDDSLSSSRFQACRDRQKEFSQALGQGLLKTPRGEPAVLPAVIELHPRFLDLLAAEEEAGGAFSLVADVLAWGHELGAHNHTECHTAAAGGAACLNASNGWGDAFQNPGQMQKPNAGQWGVRLSTYDHLVDVLHPGVLGALDFPQVSLWGTDHRYALDPDATIAAQAGAGYRVVTSHGMIPSQFDQATSPACYAAEVQPDATGALVHLRTLATSDGSASLLYGDNRPVLFGEAEFSLPSAADAFERTLLCMREEQSAQQPYVHLVATHLHNLFAEPAPGLGWSGLADLQSFVTSVENLAGRRGVRVEYTTFAPLLGD